MSSNKGSIQVSVAFRSDLKIEAAAVAEFIAFLFGFGLFGLNIGWRHWGHQFVGLSGYAPPNAPKGLGCQGAG